MSFVADLESSIRTSLPEWEITRSEDGRVLLIAEPEDDGSERERLAFHVSEEGGAIVLDWAWRFPLEDGKTDELRARVLKYVTESIENRGWEVPVILQGGPLHGKQLTKPREDLVGRLMFARKENAGKTQCADLYKWLLQQNAEGEYVCAYERSLFGEEVDRFIARGVESTGPFVLIHDIAR